MTFESLELLPDLLKLPIDETAVNLGHEARQARIIGMDRDHFSIELSAAIEAPLVALFEARNVSDVLRQAHGLAFSDSDLTLHEHYLDVVGRGEQSVTGFVSALKGKVAELQAPAVLEERFPGYKFSLASDPTQPIWDLKGVGPEGSEEILIQVKAGGTAYASEVVERMEDTAPGLLFAVTQEIYDKIVDASPELSGRLVDIQVSAHKLTGDVLGDLELLARNHGIDLPDSIGEILPYVGEIVAGIKLIVGIISVEREFAGADFDDRSKVHVVKALALMARFGITSVCVTLGATAGTIAVPGLGTAAGAVGGGGLAVYLNRRLKPRMREVAMRVVDLTDDDLFYFRNKAVVDRIGGLLASTIVG